jgi:hypothetical protein
VLKQIAESLLMSFRLVDQFVSILLRIAAMSFLSQRMKGRSIARTDPDKRIVPTITNTTIENNPEFVRRINLNSCPK